MKFNELDEHKESIFAFIKFTKKEYVESLKQGNLYMNNFKYFIDLEKTTGTKGMGDQYEGAQVLNDMIIYITDPDTHEQVKLAVASKLTFRADRVLTKPLFCLTLLTSDNIKIVNETNEYIEGILNFSEEQKTKIINEFGECAVILSPDEFMRNLLETLKNENFSYKTGKVIYDDYTQNTKHRLDSYSKKNNEIFFWKDNSFKYQQEFRVVITDLDVESNYVLSIGKFKKIVITETAELLNNGLPIKIPKTREIATK